VASREIPEFSFARILDPGRAAMAEEFSPRTGNANARLIFVKSTGLVTRP
jgi:hypothetical protein